MPCSAALTTAVRPRVVGALVAVLVPLLLALGAALAVPAVAAPAVAAQGGAAPEPRQADHDRAALYDLLDDAREDHGLAPLRRDPGVEAVAQEWAEAMARSGELSHNLDLRAELPAGSSAGGENVGVGSRARPGGVHRAWLASRAHRANALSSAYDTVGVGVVHDAGGRLWATVDFGSYH